jgi:beta-glucosidase
MVYEEGLNVGYRHFTSRNVPVLYPFGFGLSYSDFRYSDLQVEVSGDSVEVRLWVENVSDKDGKEVVQLYVHEEDPAVYHPVRELKAFEKVLVKAHEKKQIVLTLNREAFAYYSVEKNQWTLNKGTFAIQIGKNANEILLEKRIAFA